MTCLRCDGNGLIRVAYQSDEPFDLAMCTCAKGQYFRRAGVRFIANVFGIDSSVHRIAELEHFEDVPVPAPAARGSFTEAGRTRPRAKL